MERDNITCNSGGGGGDGDDSNTTLDAYHVMGKEGKEGGVGDRHQV